MHRILHTCKCKGYYHALAPTDHAKSWLDLAPTSYALTESPTKTNPWLYHALQSQSKLCNPTKCIKHKHMKMLEIQFPGKGLVTLTVGFTRAIYEHSIAKHINLNTSMPTLRYSWSLFTKCHNIPHIFYNKQENISPKTFTCNSHPLPPHYTTCIEPTFWEKALNLPCITTYVDQCMANGLSFTSVPKHWRLFSFFVLFQAW